MQPAPDGIADVHGGGELTRQRPGPLGGLGAFTRPASMILRSARRRVECAVPM
jgi:hypothetical protein